MGAWGTGPFENDTALDFAAEIASVEDLLRPLSIESPELEIDADQACEIIVVAECVAAMRGHPSKEIPDDLAERVHGFGKPSMKLFDDTRDHLSAVIGRSELSELWAEAEPEDRAAYNVAMTDLMERLNKPQKKARKPRKKKVFNNSPCSFCSKPMGEEEFHQFDITLQADDISTMKQGGWAHISCLNAALHPKHMIQTWQFDDELLEYVMEKIAREDAERD